MAGVAFYISKPHAGGGILYHDSGNEIPPGRSSFVNMVVQAAVVSRLLSDASVPSSLHATALRTLMDLEGGEGAAASVEDMVTALTQVLTGLARISTRRGILVAVQQE